MQDGILNTTFFIWDSLELKYCNILIFLKAAINKVTLIEDCLINKSPFKIWSCRCALLFFCFRVENGEANNNLCVKYSKITFFMVMKQNEVPSDVPTSGTRPRATKYRFPILSQRSAVEEYIIGQKTHRAYSNCELWFSQRNESYFPWIFKGLSLSSVRSQYSLSFSPCSASSTGRIRSEIICRLFLGPEFLYARKLLLICNTLRVPNRHVIFIR